MQPYINAGCQIEKNDYEKTACCIINCCVAVVLQ